MSLLTAGLISTFEPTAIVVVRQGRNHSLTSLFGVLCCWFAFPPPDKTSNTLARFLLAALFLGLAIATHPVGIVYSAVLAAALFAYWAGGARRRAVPVFATAAAVPCLLWVATFRGDSLLVLRQMAVWARTSAPMPNLTGDAWNALLSGDASGFIRLGGLLFAILAMPACALAAILWSKKGGGPVPRLPAVLAVSCTGVILGLLVFFGTRPTRLVVVFPVAILAFGVCLGLAERRMRQALLVVATLVLLFEAVASAVVLKRVHSEYALRDPQRFVALMQRLPATAAVAGDTQLWYAFVSAGRNFRDDRPRAPRRRPLLGERQPGCLHGIRLSSLTSFFRMPTNIFRRDRQASSQPEPTPFAIVPNGSG